MSKYGIKIKNFSCGMLYEYNLGVRKYLPYTNAMFTNNLFSDFLQQNGLRVSKDGKTRDIICINFDMGTKTYERTKESIENKLEYEENDVKIEKYKDLLEYIGENEDKFISKTRGDIRKEYYTNGVNVTYTTRNKDGSIKKQETIHYKMLYRSTGKAKEGSCMFICDRLYKKAHNFLYMGIELPKENTPIVEASAYISLITSSIVDRIKINPKNILILKDVDSYFRRDIISIETDEKKRCFSKKVLDYELKNTLFDGQALIDSSIFPKWGNGYILLRHHMTKMAAFKSNIQIFFKDYFGDAYNTAQVEDMFGNKHYVRDIKVITTDNAMKWLKFDISYEYWCNKVNENNNTFGIVKTAHKSKLGDVQKMSYQMVNSLNTGIMDNVLSKSKDYVNSLKKDNDVFMQYLRENSNFSNDFDVLASLCNQDCEFIQSEYFRNRKKQIIHAYVKRLKLGKIIQEGDNLVIVGSPYAMLLHSVGEDVEKDDTFSQEDGAIQCYTKRFNQGEYLAEFRSPFNSKNNMGHLHNVNSDKLDKYFDLGKQCIAVNMIGTDFQDRNNGLIKWVS